MFPFCSCVCQDYNNWLIISNNPNKFLTSNFEQESLNGGNRNSKEKSLEIIFPNCGKNNQFVIPDVTKASMAYTALTPDMTGGQLTALSPISDMFTIHLPEHLSHLPFPNQDKNCQSLLSKEDIQLLNKINYISDQRRLVRIQRSKKFIRRRQSFNFYQNIRISNPDRLGLVDLSNSYLSKKYLTKYVNSWDFNIFRLNRFNGGKSSLVELGMAIFQNCNLINHFKFDIASLRQFLYSIQSVYHSFNPYHNALHSADVAQSMHCFLSDKKIKAISEPVDVLGCIIAALCHDADHPGLNQLYLEKINHFFVSLYNRSSVLENHHIRVTVSLLHQSTLLNFLSAEDWRTMFPNICNLILATDITHQKTYLNRFINLHHEKRYMTSSNLNFTVEEKTLVYQMALKCSDISNPSRSWPVSLGWASLVCEEFFLQGDTEKTQGLSVLSTHDRCMSTKADIQLGFIRFIVRPLITQWNCFLKSNLTLTLVKQVDINLNNWELFKQKFTAISAKILQSPTTKVEANIPLISGLETLTEETTLTSSCITKHQTHYQRRFSLPDNVTIPSKNKLKGKHNVSTTIITFPRISIPMSCRRVSLPQHSRPSSVTVPDNSRRRGSLPLNVRSFPIPTAWEEEEDNNEINTELVNIKPTTPTNDRLHTRRGSAPLIEYPRCGQDCSMSIANSNMIKGFSREQMLLEVYWMTASSSVSSTNSVHGTSVTNIHTMSSVPHSSSSSSSRNDSGTGVMAI